MRDDRVHTAPHVSAGIYLQGGAEHAHGITAILQSNPTIRVSEILVSILANGSAVELFTPAFAAIPQRC